MCAGYGGLCLMLISSGIVLLVTMFLFFVLCSGCCWFQTLLLKGFGTFCDLLHSFVCVLKYAWGIGLLISYYCALCWHNMCVLASWKYLFKTLHFLNVMPHCHVLLFGCLWFSLIFHFDVLCLFLSYVVIFMLSVLNVRMLSICAYHGHGRLSHWQLFLNLCFSMLYCTFTILLHLTHCAL